MKRLSKSIGSLLSLLVMAMLFSACVQRQVELSFETIEKEVIPRGVLQGTEVVTAEWYEEKEPKLIIVTALDEVPSLNPNLSPDARPKLSDTDFDSYFVIAVFQGWKAVLDYEVRIERITYLDETVKVFARFVEPAEGQMLHLAASSPYHVARVEKPQKLAGKEVRFILVANDREVVSEVHRLT